MRLKALSVRSDVAGESAGTVGSAIASVVGGLRWGIDRSLSVGYGVVWDYIFDRFRPYQLLRAELLGLVEGAVAADASRRDIRILDVGCGPGNFTVTLAQAGFSVVGVDPYSPLIELAREKRRAQRLPNLAFQQADVAQGAGLWEGTFDQVVSVHTLYVHPAPDQILAASYRALRAGGYAIFVNHTRRLEIGRDFAEVRASEGAAAAMRSLVWLVPNAIFEATRKPVGPHYWSEDEFGVRLCRAGFTVLQMRRTFFNASSVLAWVRKDSEV